ncbi:MAG: glycosyltransferase [Erysipelotrichaceae bacterium]
MTNEFKDKISIIVPVYNVGCYLNRCVDSILAQTYKNIEIILIDDGSTDNSGEICDDYSKKYDIVKTVHKENGGVAKARNQGITLATGDYIGFVDGDDYIGNEMYSFLYNNLIKNNADISICSYYEVYGNKTIRKNNNDVKFVMNTKETEIMLFTDGNFESGVWDKLFAKKALKNSFFNTNVNYGEELQFLFNCIENAQVIVYESKPHYYYFQREDSVTHVLEVNEGPIQSIKYLLMYLKENKYDETIIRLVNTRYVLSMFRAFNVSLQIKENDIVNKRLKKELFLNRKFVYYKSLNSKKMLQLKLFFNCPFVYVKVAKIALFLRRK